MTSPRPDLVSLTRWFLSWVTEEGAINGFHNHSVWGTNPATFLDWTSGHAAFSAPATGAIAQLVAARPDPRAIAMWRRMMYFQSHALQDDDQYRHVGFQVGESATTGLIHNATGSIGLLLGLKHAGHLLDEPEVDHVVSVVRRNLVALQAFGGGRPAEDGTCNQEYARVWVKMLLADVTGDGSGLPEIREDLDVLIERHHQPGVPDEGSSGTWRQAGDRAEGGHLEPAEYYGLMIVPLVLGYERFGDPRYLDEALRLCRHVARSAWTDAEGRTRFHRYWYVAPGRTLKADTPMLIAGMGLSLYGMREVCRIAPDAELEDFVARCRDTYAHYQVPAGYFASATHWGNEADVAPSTAWHAHDLVFLADDVADPGEDFWTTVFESDERQSVLMTDRAVWAEHGVHWCIRSPMTAGDLDIYGRKDRAVFGRAFFAWTDKEPLAEDLHYPDAPLFLATNDGMYRVDRSQRPTDVSVLGTTYRGRL
ncbi:hypothetical protein [Nitriliruptor alkaliphilus]|uniref:hypothetical protein n=1 Tax=Nitriliruptor alkaliphilus TaxID=427918 RepID=UPI000A5A167D|nr:hypothetical protein [Nitriliruptor alkaliphilus]